jgi:hypothetical protein
MVTATVAVFLIIFSVIDTSVAVYQFRASLYNGVSNYYNRPGSGISWVNSLYDPGSGYCNVRGTIRIPFYSHGGDCYKFKLNLKGNPSGYNFHIDDGCGSGWGGTPGCYEVHNSNRDLAVYGLTSSSYSTFKAKAVSYAVTVIVRRGQVKFYKDNVLMKTASHPTLFTSHSIYFSMNRVYNLTAHPNLLRVGNGHCSVYIYKTCLA